MELPVTSNQSLPSRVVSYSNKQIRDTGYTQNLEAEIEAHQHDKTLSTAEHVVDATKKGADLEFSEEQPGQFVYLCQ